MNALSRRGFGALVGAALLASREAPAALRVPRGGALRIPLPAPRRTLDPMRATDLADVWSLALAHDTLATSHPDNGVSYPLLEERPRAEGGAFVLRLREAITASNGAALDAEALVRCWSDARATAPGRLALALLAPMDPFRARGPRELVVRAARGEALEEFLAAPCMAPTVPATGGGRAGIGPFAPEGGDPNALVRNAMCPRGAAYLERVTLSPPRARDDELRAFATGELDASWWPASNQ